MYEEIPLDSKTILLQATAKDILSRTAGKRRKGIDFKLYQIPGSSKEDIQTVMTLLASKYNPVLKYQKEKEDVEKLLNQTLDTLLISDRVRSCSDYYKTNNKTILDNKMRVG